MKKKKCINEELWLLCQEHDTVLRRYFGWGRLLQVSSLSLSVVITLQRKYITPSNVHCVYIPVYKLLLLKKKSLHKNNVSYGFLGEMSFEKYVLYTRANTPSRDRKFVNKFVYGKANRKGGKRDHVHRVELEYIFTWEKNTDSKYRYTTLMNFLQTKSIYITLHS